MTSWPPTLSPANSPVYVRIEQAVRAEPATVWESRNSLIHTFHVWQLVPAANGSTVVDEECQRGLLPWTARAIQRRALHRVHQQWLTDLAVRVGPPIFAELA